VFFCLKLKGRINDANVELPSSSHVCICLCGFLLGFFDWPGDVRRKLSLRSNSHPVIRLLSFLFVIALGVDDDYKAQRLPLPRAQGTFNVARHIFFLFFQLEECSG
jgi:hypothetical protein